MAISKLVEHYALLNRWQDVLNIDPFHFNQVAGAGAPYTKDNCRSVWIQPEREMVARALYNAVQKMQTYLSFSPRPQYFEERVPFGRGSPYQLQFLQTKHLKLIEFGQRATSLIQAGVTVTYSDDDGDTIHDLATISVTTSVDTDEIAVFFQTTDGAPSAANTHYEIAPLTISGSGGVATITAPRAYFVKPTIWAKPYDTGDPNSLEHNDANTQASSHFVTAVDVYRVYTDTTTPLQVYGDPIYTQDSQLDQSLATTGVARIVDPELGLYEARVDSCNCVAHHIQGVRVYYKAGQALVDGRMEAQLEEAAIRLANTLMPQKPSNLCDIRWEMWDTDRQSMKVDNMVVAQERDLGNPFGMLQGQIAAWHVVRDYAIRRGGKVSYGVR